jgi:hypothetical protein
LITREEIYHDTQGLVAFSLALAVSLLPSAAFAHAGDDHGTKAKKVKKAKPKKGEAELVVPLRRL